MQARPGAHGEAVVGRTHENQARRYAMPVRCSLALVDGAVFCPKSERWLDPQSCKSCQDLLELHSEEETRAVVCAPRAKDFGRLISTFARA